MKKAASTRHTILIKAFDLIYKKGYQTTSIDEILATTKVTKGAFYYHFKNKDEMGLAIINEILTPETLRNSIQRLKDSGNPIEDIYNVIKDLLLNNSHLEYSYGCPMGNLSQEMTPWNDKFREALHKLAQLWTDSIVNAINKGIKEGYIRQNVEAKQAARFIISSYWGIRNFGKIDNSNSTYTTYLKELKNYLEGLK